MQKKRIHKGSSDFKEFIENNCYYVDKTLFIKDVIEGDKVQLYARPRRFGKTLNLSMLYYFFTNENNYSYLFKGLKIEKDKNAMSLQGKFPVILLSFKNAKKSTFEETFNNIKELISLLYKQHFEELKDDLQFNEKGIYLDIIRQSASPTNYDFSLQNLIDLLYRKYNKKVIVLLDEYDVPIQQGYLNNFYREITNFIHILFTASLKDNPNIERAVLTGVTRVSKESIFSGLNNIEVNTILQSYAADKFGFTEYEINEIVDYYEIQEILPTLNEWYNGYNIAGHKIFNPWSVMSFIEKRIPDVYWANTSDNALIKDMLQRSNESVKTNLYDFLEGKQIKIDVNEHTEFGTLNINDRDILFSFLMLSGYLTYTNMKFGEDKSCEVYIPNKEIKMVFEKDIIPNWFKNEKVEESITSIMEYLLKGNINEFKRSFINYVEETLSYFDVGGRQPERFYQALMLGMFVLYKKDYIIKSNRETGYGRADIMMIPKDNNGIGLIFEFKKFYPEAETLDEAFEKAKNQIIENNYEAEIKSFGVEKIIKLIIIFDGKKVYLDLFS